MNFLRRQFGGFGSGSGFGGSGSGCGFGWWAAACADTTATTPATTTAATPTTTKDTTPPATSPDPPVTTPATGGGGDGGGGSGGRGGNDSSPNTDDPTTGKTKIAQPGSDAHSTPSPSHSSSDSDRTSSSFESGISFPSGTHSPNAPSALLGGPAATSALSSNALSGAGGSNALSPGLIAAIVLTIATLLILLGLAVFYLRRRVRASRRVHVSEMSSTPWMPPVWYQRRTQSEPAASADEDESGSLGDAMSINTASDAPLRPRPRPRTTGTLEPLRLNRAASVLSAGASAMASVTGAGMSPTTLALTPTASNPAETSAYGEHSDSERAGHTSTPSLSLSLSGPHLELEASTSEKARYEPRAASPSSSPSAQFSSPSALFSSPPTSPIPTSPAETLTRLHAIAQAQATSALPPQERAHVMSLAQMYMARGASGDGEEYRDSLDLDGERDGERLPVYSRT